MKKNLLVGMGLLGIMLTISGCGKDANVQELKDVATLQQEKVEVGQSEIKENQIEGNWMNLTPEQRLKDFDYLYEVLKENYPYFGVSKRAGIDMEEAYQRLRGDIEQCSNDDEYFELLTQFCSNGIGHLNVWGTRYFSLMDNFKAWSEDNSRYKRLYKVLDNEVSKVNYAKMQDYEQKKEQEQSQLKSVQQPQLQEQIKIFENVETQIIKKDEIAYIAIHTFDPNYYEESKTKIFDFYKKVKDYPHLIIDLCDNCGGGMSYYNDLIVAPNITEPLTVPTYFFMKGGAINKTLIDFDEVEEVEGLTVEPIENVPQLVRLNEEDKAEFDYFIKQDYVIEPLGEEKQFKGKIWMLVNENNYSSSEYAAMFTKASGFATLVGRTTGGDGIGIDPCVFVLPESGFIVQYSAIYGTTSDGASSEEFGTTPDILCAENEDPLEKCLECIKKE